MTEDPVRWFEDDPPRKCQECARPAQGVLRGPMNESYGRYCKRCANKRLITAYRSRGETYVVKRQR